MKSCWRWLSWPAVRRETPLSSSSRSLATRGGPTRTAAAQSAHPGAQPAHATPQAQRATATGGIGRHPTATVATAPQTTRAAAENDSAPTRSGTTPPRPQRPARTTHHRTTTAPGAQQTQQRGTNRRCHNPSAAAAPTPTGGAAHTARHPHGRAHSASARRPTKSLGAARAASSATPPTFAACGAPSAATAGTPRHRSRIFSRTSLSHMALWAQSMAHGAPTTDTTFQAAARRTFSEGGFHAAHKRTDTLLRNPQKVNITLQKTSKACIAGDGPKAPPLTTGQPKTHKRPGPTPLYPATGPDQKCPHPISRKSKLPRAPQSRKTNLRNRNPKRDGPSPATRRSRGRSKRHTHGRCPQRKSPKATRHHWSIGVGKQQSGPQDPRGGT